MIADPDQLMHWVQGLKKAPPANLPRVKLPAVALSKWAGEVSGVADWALRGHAAQWVIAAWHLNWEPARSTGGGRWTDSILAALLSDDYGPVRFVAARGLRRDGSRRDWNYDFAASVGDRAEAIRSIRARIDGAGRIGGADSGEHRLSMRERLLTPEGMPDWGRVESLLKDQDRRSITANE